MKAKEANKLAQYQDGWRMWEKWSERPIIYVFVCSFEKAEGLPKVWFRFDKHKLCEEIRRVNFFLLLNPCGKYMCIGLIELNNPVFFQTII